jgi:hypothetical protein
MLVLILFAAMLQPTPDWTCRALDEAHMVCEAPDTFDVTDEEIRAWRLEYLDNHNNDDFCVECEPLRLIKL